MTGFLAEGAGDLTRLLVLRDASKGTDEPSELGWLNGLVVGIVDLADQDTGLPTKVRSGLLEPRNWHESELKAFSPDLPLLKDRRYGVSLVADHEHDFPGWALDKDPKSPFLDDWFYDAGLDAIQKSTRIVDYLDPKGRTALLAQLVKVTDDHLGEYTAAIVLGRDVGNHEIAAAGYVWDNQRDFNGLLDTFWITRHEDTYGRGRENTPYGILSERTDAHFDWPNKAEHGRIKFQRLNIGGLPLGRPRYKATLGWDPTVANEDSELGLENGQWRPWYHCVDKPERPVRPPPPPDPSSPGTPPLPGPPPPPPPARPDLIIGLDELRRLLEGEVESRTPSPSPDGEGRIISLPLSSNPPVNDGVEDAASGYLAISAEPDGSRALWLDGRRTAAPDLGGFWERI
ncbi:MAG TPA: hypothetical protein VFF73_06015, partial [Planctomycetota bacterium]|nr:hypothetical protein [Planctomycetota bacterium]